MVGPVNSGSLLHASIGGGSSYLPSLSFPKKTLVIISDRFFAVTTKFIARSKIQEMTSSVTQEPSADHRNWAELPWDVLSVIFEKLGAFEILLTAQAVCRPWWRLSLEPRIWLCVDLVRGASDRDVELDFEKIAMAAVDRGSGQLEKFYTNIVNDELLKYISDRCIRKCWITQHPPKNASR